MKKLMLILILSLCFFAVGTANEKSKAKKFDVVITVTYNAITLDEAAQKEAQFRKQFTDACVVDIDLRSAVNVSGTSGDVDFQIVY